MLLPLVLSVIGFFLLWKGYGAATKRDKRFRKGSKFVMTIKTAVFWLFAFAFFATAAFFLNHS